MNDALCRGAWDKGCTDIMYMIIEYPNYPIISLLTQLRRNCVNMLWLRNSSFTSGFELEFSPPQLNALPLSYGVPHLFCWPSMVNLIYFSYHFKQLRYYGHYRPYCICASHLIYEIILISIVYKFIFQCKIFFPFFILTIESLI